MGSGVEIKTLGEICEVISGGTPSRAIKEFWENGDIPWIKIGNLKGKYVNKSDECITKLGLENSATKLLPRGTILYSIFATLGETGILSIEACTNQAIAGIIINDKMQVSTEYLYYFLKSKKKKVNNIGRGVAQNNINISMLKGFKILLPEYVIQRKMVDIFDKIENIIEIRKAELESLDKLVRARFVELFGDIKNTKSKFKTRKLGEVAIIGSSHRVFTTEFVDKGIPFYRGTEISDLSKGIKPNCMYYISEEHYNRISSDNTKPKIGDLLMPSICNKGQVWMVDTDEPFYYKDGRVLCISPNRDIFNTRYLEHFMKEKTQEEYAKLGSGSTFAEFKIFLLKDIDILVPPIGLQNDFATFVEQVNKSKLLAASQPQIHIYKTLTLL